MVWQRKTSAPTQGVLDSARIEKAMSRASQLDTTQLLSWAANSATDIGARIAVYVRDPSDRDALRDAHLAAESTLATLTVAVGRMPPPQPTSGPPRPPGLGRARIG